MLVLALDSTSRAGSVALTRDDVLVGLLVGDPSVTHSRRLPGDLLRPLETHGVTSADIDVYGVAVGPGSFTGLRVGIASVQGLAFAHARPVVPVSTFAALALAVDRDAPLAAGQFLAAIIDAGRREVFAALFRKTVNPDAGAGAARHDRGLVTVPAGFELLGEPSVGSASALAYQWHNTIEEHGVLMIGSGVAAYRTELAGLGPGAQVRPDMPPLAPAIARIAARQHETGLAVPPHAIRPVYVRRPDAELARDRSTPGHRGS